MKTNLFNAKHHSVTGPGGWNCACCGPAPRHRKKAVRIHKRRIYRMLDQQVKQETL